MNKEGYEILQNFYQRLSKLSATDRRKIESIAMDGTFGGAAWSYFHNKKYSPYKKHTKTDVSPRSKQATKTDVLSQSKPTASKPATKNASKRSQKQKSPPQSKQRVPYVKELKPGIRTILFKTIM